MKYPAIYTNNNDYIPITAVIYQDRAAYHLEGKFKGEWSNDCTTIGCTEITRGYLEGKCLRITSLEHGEFVQKLAFDAGFQWKDSGRKIQSLYECYFKFHPNGDITYTELGFVNGFRQITIPLPPKEEKSEWPKVGDEVLIDLSEYNPVYGKNVDGLTCTVRSVFKDGDVDVYAVSREGVCYCFVGGVLKKPKTEGDILREWLQERIGYAIASGFDCEQITHDLLHHCDISKKKQE